MNDGLSAVNVHHAYVGSSSKLVLGGVDIHVPRGSIAAIIGVSGVGKTTLLAILAGLVRPDGGVVCLDGKVVAREEPSVGYMLQSDILLPWLDVIDNVALPLALAGISQSARRDRARQILRQLHLDSVEKKLPHQLSGGMRKRASLARLLVREYGVLLLDEPFTGVDFDLQVAMETEVKALVRRERIAAVIVTHSIETAVSVADKVHVVSPTAHGGRIRDVIDVAELASMAPIDARASAAFACRFSEALRAYRRTLEGPVDE